jgi:hypothetical protein
MASILASDKEEVEKSNLSWGVSDIDEFKQQRKPFGERVIYFFWKLTIYLVVLVIVLIIMLLVGAEEVRVMKVSELIVALEQYNPSADVMIASTPYGKYFNFVVKEQTGLAVTEEALSGAVTLQVADEISQYTLTL